MHTLMAGLLLYEDHVWVASFITSAFITIHRLRYNRCPSLDPRPTQEYDVHLVLRLLCFGTTASHDPHHSVSVIQCKAIKAYQ